MKELSLEDLNEILMSCCMGVIIIIAIIMVILGIYFIVDYATTMKVKMQRKKIEYLQLKQEEANLNINCEENKKENENE